MPEHGAEPASHDTERLVRAARLRGVRDERLLRAIGRVPRGSFVPPDMVPSAYLDEPLRIPHGQVTTQPSLVAQMVEALELTGEERMLEVGTGHGWQTALLASLARTVWSVERWPDLGETARANLAAAGITNAHVVLGDGTVGLPGEAPFDAVIVAAAFQSVPPPLASQLVPGGRLVQPIGPGGDDDVTLFERSAEGLVRIRSVVPAHFVRLYGRHAHAHPDGVAR